MSVNTISHTGVGTGDKYIFTATITDSHISCVNIMNGNYSMAVFTENYYPEECGSFENFKLAMKRVGKDGNKLFVTFDADGKKCTFKCNKDNNEYFYKFVMKLQPYIPRTNAMILAEIETYMKSIDNQLQQLFTKPEEHCTFFGNNLVEKKEEFNVETAIRKIVEISGLTKEEFMNKPQFCVFVERLNVIKQLHEKFVERIQKKCNGLCEELPAFLIDRLDRKYTATKLQGIIGGRVTSCLMGEACIEQIPIYEFNMGKLVDMHIGTSDYCKNCDNYNNNLDTITRKIVAKIVSGELLPDVPRFIIDVGKFDKMLFCEDFDHKMAFGQNGFETMTKIISTLHQDLSPSVIQTAFKHPTANGILIDETATLDEMQQHIVDILNEKYDEWMAKPVETSNW